MTFWFRAYLGCVAFSVGGLLIQRATGQDALWIARVMSMLTLACGLMAASTAMGVQLRAAATVWALGLTVEVMGLASGFPFGRYEYTSAWWPALRLASLGWFPALLPFAWLMMVAGAVGVASLASSNRTQRSLIAGLFAMLADIPLEYAATGRLGYWRWLDSPPGWVAPWQNFVAWFAVASIGAWLLSPTIRPPAPRIAAAVLLIHVAFTLFVVKF